MKDRQIKIFNNGWRQKGQKNKTVCGSGSLLESCREYIQVINNLLEKEDIKVISDIGCGDLNYIKHTKINKTHDYLGYDFIPLLDRSNDIFKIFPESFDASEKDIRKSDLIICKDVLNHLDQSQIISALNRIKKNTTYLILTNYNDIIFNKLKDNFEARWVKINFNIEPYNLCKNMISTKNINHIRREHNDISVNLYKF